MGSQVQAKPNLNSPTGLLANLDREKRQVEAHLRYLLRQQLRLPNRLRRAMAHSLFAGGKRLRPILLLWAYDAIAQDRRRSPRGSRRHALAAGCALEMLHTYSLIHDDLPAMDDDVLRRGRPTCHVEFDEATAILAGDGLQALAFGILARLGKPANEVIQMVAQAVGPAGMVAGQQEDLDSEGKPVTAHQVLRIHERKTALMIAVALAAGASLAGAGPAVLARLQRGGRWLGLAFQGADDLLDVTGTDAQLGKTVGKDAVAEKATWIRVEGFEAARQRTVRYGRRSLEQLRGCLPTGLKTDRLLALATLMWQRDR